MQKRTLLQFSAAALLGTTFAPCASQAAKPAEKDERLLPVVYRLKGVSPEKLLHLWLNLNVKPEGPLAVKLTVGEPGSNYLRPTLLNPLIAEIRSKTDLQFVDSNTIYGRWRRTTESHLRVAQSHGFTELAPFDVLDADGEMELPVVNGRYLKSNAVGARLLNYRSILVLSHFKGHTMAGFGGAIKNLSIGIASPSGKARIHGTHFMSSMAEAAKTVCERFAGRIWCINVLNRLSLDCDCEEHPRTPVMKDLGLLVSTDPVAVDQAGVDWISAAPDGGELASQIRSHGFETLAHAEEIGLGSRKYKLVDLI